MAKTACEEAADQLDQGSDLCKRLRAEGRELRMLRKMVVACLVSKKKGLLPHAEAVGKIYAEAARIQKARKK